jgi:hypothetical protein
MVIRLDFTPLSIAIKVISGKQGFLDFNITSVEINYERKD